jgi:hypothetical protein
MHRHCDDHSLFWLLLLGLVVLDASKPDASPPKYDYRKGGRRRWLGRVDAVDLTRITPQRIQAWKVAFFAKCGQNPTEQQRSMSQSASVLDALPWCNKTFLST